MSWSEFSKRELVPRRTIRTGKRWLREGVIRGREVRNPNGQVIDILVDMDDWWGVSTPGPQSDIETRALELLL